ncbi:MAG: ABC transporter-associated protein EcsC [Azospira oryzae]|jgi:hypothetical protein|nr:MAG: ABC transporter-associated protein EcsC [Azospira oryzae]
MPKSTHLISIYDRQAFNELSRWQKRMKKRPSLINQLSGKLQARINKVIPEGVHQAITTAIKQMTRAMIFGAGITTQKPLNDINLEGRERKVVSSIKTYRNTATAEGAITGAGGILLGLADFPLWLSIKMKMLFDIAAKYGIDTSDYKERVYLLHIFQLTFSSQKHRNKIYHIMANWEEEQKRLPDDLNSFEWRTFQQEYRDYIDLAKLLQLVPGIGAVVGAYVNHRLTTKLGKYAMNAYRMRLASWGEFHLNLPAADL